MDNTFFLLLGALVGAAVQPLFISVSEVISKKSKKQVGLHSAFLLLFLTNAFILIGEILIFPPIGSGLPGLTLIFLLALALCICAIYNIQKKSRFFESELVTPIKWLIFGNLAWGVSDVAELILIEFGASGDPGDPSRWVRILISLFGVACFVKGAYIIFNLIPSRGKTE